MRTSKSTLAGVAAGALVAGVVPFALFAGSASAATGTASVSPVRFTTSVAVPNARASFDLTMGGTTSVALTVAPAGGSLVVSDDTTVTLAAAGTNVTVVNGGSDDSYIELTASAAGRYAGSIYDGTDTATFDFTTVGSPASMTLTPASQTVLEGATATLAVTLLDASGNVTQPASVDSVGLAVDTDDTLSAASLSAATLFAGTANVTLNTAGNGAGTATVTATPLGTLPSYGLSAQTAAVVKSGTVSSVDAKSISVTSPANAVSVPANTDDTVDRAVAVPTGTSSVTITIDDTTANSAGQQLRFSLLPSAGTVTVGGESGSSTSALFVDVTTDADLKATINATLSGAATLASANLTVKQVDVTDTDVSAGAGIVVTQTNRAVSTSTITVSPDDSVVGTLGGSIPVTVTVSDQFGGAQAGWTINAYRGAAVSGGTFLSTGTTNSSGEATVSVTNATGATTGTMENYSFNAVPSLGSAVAVDNPLQVTWTTDGGITSLSVAVAGGSSTPITDPAGTAPTTGPLLTVPYDGTADTGSTAYFDLSTEAAGGTANSGDVVAITPTATPLNNVTVTVPLGSTGIFVSESSSTAWDEGKTSVTVSSGTPVYVFGTKAGRTSVDLTSGGKTVSVEVMVQTETDAAYNIALLPSAQILGAGAIGNVTLSVTDVFGNPVDTTDDTGAVTIAATGEVLLAGFQPSATFTTNSSGEATVTVIAGNAGDGTLTATPASGDAAPAWQTGYTAPTNAPAPVASAAATVTVTSSSTKSITITGERGTVNGKPGIKVDGLTTGFAEGDKVKPWIKFPGQTSYSEGSARPVIDADGEFYWQRKTGKKIYVYFTNEDGSVKSDRIIIQAK